MYLTVVLSVIKKTQKSFSFSSYSNNDLEVLRLVRLTVNMSFEKILSCCDDWLFPNFKVSALLAINLLICEIACV